MGREDDQAYARQLRDLVGGHALEAQVRFCGFTDEVPRYMAAVDAVVFPSVCEESCPLVLCEAMAAGKPIVTTGLGAQGEIVANGCSGFVVEAFSPQAIAEKVGLLFHDPGLRAGMGAEGRRAAVDKFSLAAMGKNTERVFRGLTDSSRPTRGNNSDGR